MRITQINLHNYKGFKDLEIKLEGKSSVIYGINGAGKTSILNAITVVISNMLREAAAFDRRIDVQSFNSDDMYIGTDISKIVLDMDIGNGNVLLEKKRDINAGYKSSSISKCAKRIRDDIGYYSESDSTALHPIFNTSEKSIPIFVKYGINRLERSEQIIKRKVVSTANKLDAWRDSICEGKINIADFSEWYRARQEAENYRKVNGDYEYVDSQLSSYQEDVLRALGGGYSGITYKLGEQQGLFLNKHDLSLSINQLSDGEVDLIALIGDISRRLSIANPGREDAYLGEGIILIDEVDIHLHPTWQERIMSVLTSSFPNIQFIVTTHSAKILNSLDNSVKTIGLYEDENLIVAEDVESLEGWAVNDVLSRYMNTSELNPNTKKLINDLRNALDCKDIKKAEKLTDILQKMTNGTNPEVVASRVILGGLKGEIYKEK